MSAFLLVALIVGMVAASGVIIGSIVILLRASKRE